MTTNDHEVIFAIVDSGFAEDVMDVAREQGVRGGTILNARGVANQEAAAFFGITLHTEKEILMMVVEKDIRDNVLNAIYKEMDMAKKAKGIAFSLPVSDAAGLVKEPEQPQEQELRKSASTKLADFLTIVRQNWQAKLQFATAETLPSG